MGDRFRTFKSKLGKLATNTKDTIVRWVDSFVDWACENPEAAAAIVVPTVMATIKSSQSLIVSHRQKAERKRIDYTYYDPSTGFHWDLRRKPTNNDRMVIQSRKAQGQETYNILRDLRLI